MSEPEEIAEYFAQVDRALQTVFMTVGFLSGVFGAVILLVEVLGL